MPESEIITDGKNGIFFEENSLKTLRKKLFFGLIIFMENTQKNLLEKNR